MQGYLLGKIPFHNFQPYPSERAREVKRMFQYHINSCITRIMKPFDNERSWVGHAPHTQIPINITIMEFRGGGK